MSLFAGVADWPECPGERVGLLDRIARWVYWRGWVAAGVVVRFEPGPIFRVAVPFGQVLWRWAYRRHERRLIACGFRAVRPWHGELGVLPHPTVWE